MDISYYKKYEPIDGKWYITKELGSGAFGSVFEVERKDFSNMKSAMKIISIPGSQTEVNNYRSENYDLDEKSVTSYFYGFVEEFIKEFQIMSQLRGNGNIVSIEDYEVKEKDDGFGWDIFIRMELLTPMNDYFKENSPKQSDVIKLGIDMCKALEICQKYKIIHRDIKPSNIFVSDSGDFKLGDFGVARTLEKTSSGLSKKGTYTYMAPEIFKGEEYGSNVDIYSLGIVMYRLCNNNLEPFRKERTYSDGEQALALRVKGEKIPKPANADGRLAEIILKACSFDPKSRYESPIQMRMELESIFYNNSESHVIYPEGDSLEYEATYGNESSSEEGKTVSLFDDISVSSEPVVLVAEEKIIEKSKAEKPASITSNDTIEQGDIQELPDTKTDKEKEVVNTATTKFCPNCGKPVNLKQDYCLNCGKALILQNYNSVEPESELDTRSMLEIYKDYWKKYADFKGCTTRKEYWMTVLMTMIVMVPLYFIGLMIPIIAVAYLGLWAAMIIPSFSICTRRLHDAGKSGHWQWLYLTIYGSIVVLVFLCQKSKTVGNKYKR